MNTQPTLSGEGDGWEPQPEGAAVDLGGFVTWLQRHSYSTHTIRAYVRNVADCDAWLNEHRSGLAKATWRDLRAYGNTRPNSYATRSALRSALTAWWKFRNVTDPPVWAVEQPRKPRGSYRGLESAADAHKLLDAAKGMSAEAYAACCVLYYQALRREECSRLRWDQIEHGRIRGVGKGGFEFSVPLHQSTADALNALTPDGPWVFTGRWPGTHVSANTIWMWVRLAGAAAGFGRVTPHQLRHTSIGTLLEVSGNLRTAMEHARHRTPSTTVIYSRTKEKELREGMAGL